MLSKYTAVSTSQISQPRLSFPPHANAKAMRAHHSVFCFLDLLAVVVSAANVNVSGEAVTTRFWDCCKPSCAWKNKGPLSQPVESCGIDDKPIGIEAGTGCNGGTAYQCSGQQPWSVNDTFSYGFAGAFIKPELTGGKIEEAWCCACYQLDFTSDPLKGKTMIVQASNTAYDVKTENRFSLAVSFSCKLCICNTHCFYRYPEVIRLRTMRAPANTV